jgi:large subunit ribosomal protein L23
MSYVITPRMSEKAYQSTQTGTYVFNVPAGIEKAEMIKIIEADYNVKVEDVRVVIRKGKTIRSSRGKRAQPAIVARKDTKKVYVRLAEGQKLDLFGDDEKKEEKK